MSAQVIAFAATPAPQAYPPASPATPFRALPPRGLQMDFGTLLGKVERTLRWLDRHQIEVVAFACSTQRGDTVSRGHQMNGAGRFEQMEARDPSTGVLICWEEEVVR